MFDKAVEYLKSKGLKPDTFVILGSGLGEMLKEFNIPSIDIHFKDIPGFPSLTVEGHSGIITYLEYENKNFMFYRGRKHYYEDAQPDQVVFAHNVASLLGAKRGIITCSTGSVNPYFKVGDIVQVVDYIDIMFRRPYMPEIKNHSIFYKPCVDASETAAKLGINLERGILTALLGPNFETHAEVEMIRSFGADLASMSTAPEIFGMQSLGMEWLSFAVVTNVAGYSVVEVSHHEVLEEAHKASIKLLKLILAL